MELLAENCIRGWAYNDACLGAHLRILVSIDGQQVGETVASIKREDLRLSDIGDGDHGFELMFVNPLSPSILDRVQVEAHDGNAHIALTILQTSNQSRADQASNASIPITDTNQYPVFILGAARSGTSAVTLALLKTNWYEGPGEGHLLGLAHELLTVVDSYYATRTQLVAADTLLPAVTIDTFQRMVRRGFVQLVDVMFPTGRWLDKTPTVGMVRAAPLMKELWPNARFIFLKRRLIENLVSRRRKFPHEKLENHYRDWIDVLGSWQFVQPILGSSAIVVDQIDLARDSDKVATSICNFLDLPEPYATHFKENLAIGRPEQTSELITEVATLEDLKLTADEERQLVAECGPTMRMYGYSYDQSYFQEDPVAALL